MVPGAGIEPARLAAGDFESPASTNFTTRASNSRPVEHRAWQEERNYTRFDWRSWARYLLLRNQAVLGGPYSSPRRETPRKFESIQENHMKTRIWLPILLAVAALAGGCKNTLHGAGEDIERGGEKIQQNTR